VRKVSQYPETQDLLVKILDLAREAIRAGMLREDVALALRHATKEADAEFLARLN
jgi:hypothetical protein